VANIVVPVELRAGVPTCPSLSALAEARRLAGALGATVYALLVVGPEAGCDPLADPLGRAGADKVLCVTDGPAAECPVYPRWRALLAQVVSSLRPRLVLFPAGSVGQQLGPALALDREATFMPRATLAVSPPDAAGGRQLLVRRWNEAQDAQLALVLNGATNGPVARAVITLAARPLAAGAGVRAAELSALATPATTDSGIEQLDADIDPAADAELADTVVFVPRVTARQVPPAAGALPAGALVTDGEVADLLIDACPALVFLLSSRPLPAALASLRLAPDAHLVATGTRRTKPPSPLCDHVWLVDKASAWKLLEAALLERKS
jgi:electron transfer flavoprotein alpha subunit